MDDNAEGGFGVNDGEKIDLEGRNAVGEEDVAYTHSEGPNDVCEEDVGDAHPGGKGSALGAHHANVVSERQKKQGDRSGQFQEEVQAFKNSASGNNTND